MPNESQVPTAPTEELGIVLRSGLTGLEERAKSIVVTDQASYVVASQIVLDGRSYIKDVKSKLQPGINSAKTHLDELKNQMQMWITPVDLIVKTAEQKAETWREDEKRRAKDEEDRLNREAQQKRDAEIAAKKKADEEMALARKKQRIEEIRNMLRRKEITKRESEKLLREAGANAEADLAASAAAAEEAALKPAPVQKVEAAIPKVSGIKGRTNYYATVDDSAAFIAAYESAKGAEKADLRRFLVVNEQAIGKEARDTKDDDAIMKRFPGVRAWHEESI